MASLFFLLSFLLGLLFVVALLAPQRLLPGDQPKRSKAFLFYLLPSIAFLLVSVAINPDPADAFLDDLTATEIDLSGENLYRLPEEYAQFTELRKLNVSDNNMAEVPPVLFGLKTLTHLNLAENRISSLPEGLKALSQLQTLNLSGNPIAELPAWLSELPTLKTLDISHTQIEQLPAAIRAKQAQGAWVVNYTGTAAYYAEHPEENPNAEDQLSDSEAQADNASSGTDEEDHAESLGSFARRKLFGRDDLGHKRVFGEGEVYYDDPVTQAMADSVGSFMTQVGFFSDRKSVV